MLEEIVLLREGGEGQQGGLKRGKQREGGEGGQNGRERQLTSGGQVG